MAEQKWQENKSECCYRVEKERLRTISRPKCSRPRLNKRGPRPGPFSFGLGNGYKVDNGTFAEIVANDSHTGPCPDFLGARADRCPAACTHHSDGQRVVCPRSTAGFSENAIVTPLLKKPGLDSTDMNNFRPVSNLSFVSKVVERAVASQLNKYLADNDLLPCCQSAYRKGYSTKTALLRVWSDKLMAANERRLTLQCTLDMSTAFDCVDHSILLSRLQVGVGITGVVLDWITSFLTGLSLIHI